MVRDSAGEHPILWVPGGLGDQTQWLIDARRFYMGECSRHREAEIEELKRKRDRG